MEHLIKGMQKTILELMNWEAANPNTPMCVKDAIRNYRSEMVEAITKMEEAPFKIDDSVELISSSYEDGEHFSGDTGIVVDVKRSVLTTGQVEHDIRVEWDNGAEECWIPAEDFI